MVAHLFSVLTFNIHAAEHNYLGDAGFGFDIRPILIVVTTLF